MSEDDDLVFADTADDALNKTRPVKPPAGLVASPPVKPDRPPPAPDLAQRPHCLESAVLPEPLLLGRSRRYRVGRGEEVDVRIRSDQVSQQHAEVYWDGRCFAVVDLGSTNGTQVNERPIPPRQPIALHDGDRLRFGGHEVVVNALEPGEFPEQGLGGPTRKLKRAT